MRTAGVPASVTPLQIAPVQAWRNLWGLDRAGSTLMHLTDPELSPDVIAAAHHVSVRHLYKVWRTQDSVDMSLSNWIMSKRLELAASRLSDRALAHMTVAAIGGACGFTDPTHFGRRFRSTYLMTPREWRLDRR